MFAVIDLSTFRRLKWEKDIPFFLCRFVIPETGEVLPVDPRSLIAKVTDKGEAMGYKCMSGAEFEVSWNPVWRVISDLSGSQYFQFAETTKSLADKNFRNLNPLTPGSKRQRLTDTKVES